VLLIGVGLLTMGQAARAAGLKCTGADGKTSCTAAQVADINRGIVTGRRMHKPLMMVKEVGLGPNGMLQCTQTNGTACTDEQLSEIISVAATTHSGGSAFHVMKTTDKASPIL
jgi:hypothetical protein